jgi:bifunctional pyridoxal-dependent enzyme with beta-cystathionase and maltose regulon repressor activities
MEFNSRKSVNDKLKKYDYLAKDEDYLIEVTEWANGEGYDITINDKTISLTEGQLNAINYLVKSLEYKSDDD